MVDPSKAANFEHICVANPLMTRGSRLSFDMNDKFIFYGNKANMVARAYNGDHQSAVWAGCPENVSAVSLAPGGKRLAVGDVKGRVSIVEFDGRDFTKKNEFFMCQG